MVVEWGGKGRVGKGGGEEGMGDWTEEGKGGYGRGGGFWQTGKKLNLLSERMASLGIIEAPLNLSIR